MKPYASVLDWPILFLKRRTHLTVLANHRFTLEQDKLRSAPRTCARFRYTTRMTTLCIMTALAAESRVFIDAYKLRHLPIRGLRLYGSEYCLLLQTGVGKLKAAAATAALLQVRPDISCIVNAGIAGGTDQIGSVYLAHRVQDRATGMSWYPHLPLQRQVPDLATIEVQTMDKPCSTYHQGILFDMESSGIFSAASVYLSTDAMQCVKVISDNSDQSMSAVNSANCTQLMNHTVPVITQLQQWHAAKQTDNEFLAGIDTAVNALVTRVHHTTNDTLQLRRLLQQLTSVTKTVPSTVDLIELSSAKLIKQQLQEALKNAPLTYGQND